MGACVIAVARGPDKCAVLEGLGADLVIDSATLKEPLRAAIKAVAPKGGYEVHYKMSLLLVWRSCANVICSEAGAVTLHACQVSTSCSIPSAEPRLQTL